jgi:hypothetical protein
LPAGIEVKETNPVTELQPLKFTDSVNNIEFRLQGDTAPQEIIRLDSKGFHYRGQLIEDAGEAHQLMVEFLKQSTQSQPEPVAPKPVVDYSRVPEIATEAQIRAAAQYLIKKQNCDGDLIPAIEYAIARWGNSQKILASSPQPEPAAPTDEEIMELMPQQMRDDLATAARAMIGFENPKAAAACRIILNRHAVDHARAVLARWGTPANNTREEI